MGKHVINLYVLSLLMLVGFNAVAQSNPILPPLERPITIELFSNSTKEALQFIETEGQFVFAYKTDLIPTSNQMTRSYRAKTTREILDDIFQGALTYKEKGNYVILKATPKLKEQEISLEGYVLNSVTGEKVSFATIYDATTLTSTISNEYGHYSLKMVRKDTINFTVKKSGYENLTFKWEATGKDVLNLKITPEKPLTPLGIDSSKVSAQDKKVKFFHLSDEKRANLMNFKESIQRKVQFSLVPSIGTNGRLSSSTVVDYSFNLLGGFNGGVNKAEFGGLFNLDMDSVKYFQAAGVFNAVGGAQEGFQMAGLMNLNNNSFNGGQFGGFLNWVSGDFYGGQFAGFLNITKGDLNGFQGAGFANYKGDSSHAIQMAGFANYAGERSSGGQMSGFANVVGKGFDGFQTAGFMNYGGSNFRGTQLAGFINIAKNITGWQIGFININDTIDGVPFGFFSYSRKGYHQLEISANELLPVQLAFKSGTNRFYNSFLAGVNFTKYSSPTLAAGYGIGTSLGLSPKSRIYIDLQSMTLQKTTKLEQNLLTKLTVSYHYQLKNKIALAVGPSFNIYTVDDASTALGAHLVGLTPYNFYNDASTGNRKTQMWVGGHVALRFF